MGLRAGLDRCGKSRPPPGFDPRTVQPVASHYTDYVTRPSILPVLRAYLSIANTIQSQHLTVSFSNTTEICVTTTAVLLCGHDKVISQIF